MKNKIRKNMKKKLEENINFFNKWAPSYDSFIFKFFMKKFHDAVIGEIDKDKKSRTKSILDLSCGTGELLIKLSNRERLYARKLYGVDISDKMLEVARKKLPNNIILKQADVHKLPFKNNYFDYVVSTEAFHHYYDQELALKEMARVCKKKGKIILVDVNFTFLLNKLFSSLEPGCNKINNKKELRKLFRKAELQIVKQERNWIFSIITVGIK